MHPDMMDPDLHAKFFTAVTGYKIKANEVITFGERIVNLARAFNVREGLTRKDDTLPERFLKVPMPDGAAKGEIIELEPMVDRYYELRGWDKDKGFQTEKKLLELKMNDVADELKKYNKLAH
jgi:aldehyde:ferredoxin oxidoreductase